MTIDAVSEVVASALLLVGALFLLLAGIALVRMPDVYSRISASSKAVTAGAGLYFIAAAVFFEDGGLLTRALAGAAFFALTAPVAAHVVARAAVAVGIPFTPRTVLPDESQLEAMSKSL